MQLSIYLMQVSTCFTRGVLTTNCIACIKIINLICLKTIIIFALRKEASKASLCPQPIPAADSIRTLRPSQSSQTLSDRLLQRCPPVRASAVIPRTCARAYREVHKHHRFLGHFNFVYRRFIF